MTNCTVFHPKGEENILLGQDRGEIMDMNY